MSTSVLSAPASADTVLAAGQAPESTPAPALKLSRRDKRRAAASAPAGDMAALEAAETAWADCESAFSMYRAAVNRGFNGTPAEYFAETARKVSAAEAALSALEKRAAFIPPANCGYLGLAAPHIVQGYRGTLPTAGKIRAAGRARVRARK